MSDNDKMREDYDRLAKLEEQQVWMENVWDELCNISVQSSIPAVERRCSKILSRKKFDASELDAIKEAYREEGYRQAMKEISEAPVVAYCVHEGLNNPNARGCLVHTKPTDEEASEYELCWDELIIRPTIKE